MPTPSTSLTTEQPQDVSLPTPSTSSTTEQPQDAQHTPRSPSPPGLTPSGRPQRQHRLPSRFRDLIPEGPVPVETLPPPPPLIQRVILHVKDTIRTSVNAFGLFREYPHRPSYDPDSHVLLDDLSDIPRPPEADLVFRDKNSSTTVTSPPWPFANMTIYRLMQWMNTGSQMKSAREVNQLSNNVLRHPDFCAGDLKDFDAQRENERFDRLETASNDTYQKDGWRKAEIDIAIPSGVKNSSGAGYTFKVPGLQYRSLVDVIKSAFSEPIAHKFHFSPFKQFVKPANGPQMRVHGEAYTSDAYLKACDDLKKQPSEPGCKLEKVVASIMFFSDSTHLTNFGVAKAWPIYMSFGNLSKYIRAKANSGAWHHVAYIPSVRFLWHVFTLTVMLT
jgi:Plavaka transposase